MSLARRRLAAAVTQGFSYATTLNAAIYVMRPAEPWPFEATPEVRWAVTIALAAAIEYALFQMKETLFDEEEPNDAVGWLGIFLDGLINTGGFLPWAGRLLTFGPIALTLGVFGVNVADPTVALAGTFLISVILGFALSYAPHRLWRSRKRRGKAATT